MKEIDFIPIWYHKDRQLRRWYRNRCIAVLVLLLVWMVGNLFSSRIISQAHAELNSLQLAYERGLRKIELSRHLERKLELFGKREQVLNMLCPRTELSAVVGELACRVGDGVLLTSIRVRQQPVSAESKPARNSQPNVVISPAKAGSSESDVVSSEPTCWVVVIAGIAVDAGEAASLISRLEESDYFMKVVPIFSRNKQVEQREVTEFEIHCRVADYALLNQGGR